jgi:DNA-binding CsgD family transcriptional regulator
MAESALSKNERIFLSSVLLAILILVGLDLVSDYDAGAAISHLLLEFSLAACAAVGFAFVVRDSLRKTKHLSFSRTEIELKEIETAKWRSETRKHVEGLGGAIDRQMSQWALSESEKEVALLLLKGLSLKEIAEIRQTAEKTARAQSAAVYAKSGLAGRSELSAFFLEDLLTPPNRIGS